MCKPNYYGVFYEINPWMHIDIPVVQTAAQDQWKDLYGTILELNVAVKQIEPISGLPDMVFTANAGLVYQNKVWISSFKSCERQLESSYFKIWFTQEGFDVINTEYDFTKPPAFEGAGDALFFNKSLFAGYGFRSNINTYDHPFFRQFNLTLCELVDPYFYHLDTCFCPLNETLALWYPDAFSVDSQQRMKKFGRLIAIPEDEAKRFACNAVVIDRHVILPSDCPKTYLLLESEGFIVHTCNMSEFIKAGGACKCLTLCV